MYIFQARDLFPIESNVIRITQGPDVYPSHKGQNTVDYNRLEKEYEYFRAPVTLKVENIQGNSNTVCYQSLEKIKFVNGDEDYLCITLAHMDKTTVNGKLGLFNDEKKEIKVGQVFFPGEMIYREGKASTSSSHAHVRIGTGKYVKNEPIKWGDYYYYNNNKYQIGEINTTGKALKHNEAFYIDGMEVKYDNISRDGMNFKKVYFGSNISTTGYSIIPNGTKIPLYSTVPFHYNGTNYRRCYLGNVNEEIYIDEFLGFYSDGVQWVRGRTKNHFGYFPLHEGYNFNLKKSSEYASALFSVATKEKIELRKLPDANELINPIIVTVQKGDYIEVIEIIKGASSNLWVQGKTLKGTGFAKIKIDWHRLYAESKNISNQSPPSGSGGSGNGSEEIAPPVINPENPEEGIEEIDYPLESKDIVDSGLFLYAGKAIELRSVPVTGTIIATVPSSGRVNIVEFLSGQSDGFQWAKVRYQGHYVYAKIDSKALHTIHGYSAERKNVYLYADKLSYRIRSFMVDGETIEIVQVGERARIVGFYGIQSDGYQWVKVKYNDKIGFSQLDTKNAYLLQFQ